MRLLCLTLWFTFTLLCLYSTAHSQTVETRVNPNEQNISYLYSLESPLSGDVRLAMGEDEATVFLRLNLRNINIEINDISYRIKESYEADDNTGQGNISDEALIREESGERIYQFNIPIQEKSNFLFLFVEITIGGNQRIFRFDEPLNNDLNFPLTDLVVMEAEQEIPIFSNFLPKETPFRIVSLYGENKEAFIYFYSHDFEPNPPPMANRSDQVQKSLQIDSIFPIQLGENLKFEKEGLYFTQTDTTSLSGISFRVEEPYYPRMVTAEKLANPIRYISTSDEMENILDEEDRKIALDRYWIKVTRSRERAKEVIREYYRQVTKSNILFTSYKEGWKTSQGMIYLLYGPPDQVYRSSNQENWVYNDESNLMQDLSFTFVKVRNIFTKNHFNLIPDEAYSKFWYRNIDLWRKGRKQI